MIEFFLNNQALLYTYILVVALVILSIFLNKYKKILLVISLAIYIADISLLMVFGLSLIGLAIITALLVILVLISIERGRDYEL